MLPAGLQYINDGTTRIAFVTNGAGMTTTDGPLTGCAGLNVSGTGHLAHRDPGGIGRVRRPRLATSRAGRSPPARDPVFTLGSLTNNDRDADVESVVIDLNAVVLNVAANVGGTVINNAARITDNALRSTRPATSRRRSQTRPSRRVKTIITAPTQAGSSAVYQVVITNTSAFSTFDAHFTRHPAGVADRRQPCGHRPARPPTRTPRSGNTVDLVWNTLTAGQTMTVRVTAHVDPAGHVRPSRSPTPRP